MKIKKTFQGIIPENKILNSESTSETDTYSCNYINTIVETITNGNGTAVKFKDGTMICYGKFNATTGTTSTTSGGLTFYYSDEITTTFPETFVNTPTITMQVVNANATLLTFALISGESTSSFTMRLQATSSNYSRGIRYMAIGRWK